MIWNKLTVYTKSVLQLALIAVGLYLVYLTKAIILYFIIAAVLSLVAKPITTFLSTRKIGKWAIPRTLAAIITMLLLIALFTLGNILIIPQFVSELAFLNKLDFNHMIMALESRYQTLVDMLADIDLDISAEENSLRDGIADFFNVDTISSTVNGIAGGLGNMAAAAFSILFMLFFFLREKDLTHSMVNGAIPDRFLGNIENIIPKIKHILGRYFRGLLLQMTGIFTLVYVGLTFVAGVENAMVIALFAALVNLIPYIGPLIGGAFGLVIGIGQAYALGADVEFGFLTLKIMAVFGVTQLTDNILFQPIIFSNSVNAHPLEIFIVIAISGTIFGATGMILAVPAYSVIRIFAKEFLPNIKFIQSLTKNL